MNLILIALYVAALLVLSIYGINAVMMVWHALRSDLRDPVAPVVADDDLPAVTVQLPVYNELHVVERLLRAVAALDYPPDRLEIQVLDDSTDATVARVQRVVAELRSRGVDLTHVRRDDRAGFKAGALRAGNARARGEVVAIFDADFVPPPDFLRRMVPHLLADERLGMVQARWGHLNEDHGYLTRVQAMALDGHFAMEQRVRSRCGHFINFNGTAGLWRRRCIIDAGDWQSDTLTEDLDLSYRAQLAGWRMLYLHEVVAPAELPAEISGLKSQQFRWTKGAIETARKHLGSVWRADLPLRLRLQSTVHLTSNLVFPFILIIAVLNIPMILVKHADPALAPVFNAMSVFLLATVATFAFHLCAQRSLHADWRRRLRLFPLFMAGTMGLAVVNTRAVLEGLTGRRSEFVRTPKYDIRGRSQHWKRSNYHQARVTLETAVELLLALSFIVGIGVAIAVGELAMIPFQLLFLAGFGSVSLLGLRNALGASRRRSGRITRRLRPDGASAECGSPRPTESRQEVMG